MRREQNAGAAARSRQEKRRAARGFTEADLRTYHRAMYRLLVSISRFRAASTEDIELIVEIADAVVEDFDSFVLHTEAVIPRTKDDPRTAYHERLLSDPDYIALLAELWDQPLHLE